MDHPDHDRRSLALHALIVDRIRARPELAGRVRTNLERWRAHRGGRLPPALEEWHALVDTDFEAALAVATEDSERGQRMRQSSPFAGILDPRSRWRFLREWKDGNSNT